MGGTSIGMILWEGPPPLDPFPPGMGTGECIRILAAPVHAGGGGNIVVGVVTCLAPGAVLIKLKLGGVGRSAGLTLGSTGIVGGV
jgi:hypothetical protein